MGKEFNSSSFHDSIMNKDVNGKVIYDEEALDKVATNMDASAAYARSRGKLESRPKNDPESDQSYEADDYGEEENKIIEPAIQSEQPDSSSDENDLQDKKRKVARPSPDNPVQGTEKLGLEVIEKANKRLERIMPIIAPSREKLYEDMTAEEYEQAIDILEILPSKQPSELIDAIRNIFRKLVEFKTSLDVSDLETMKAQREYGEAAALIVEALSEK